MSLISKITREKLDKLIKPYGTDERVLDVGGYGMPSYSKYFKNRFTLDVKPGKGVDIVGSVYDMPFGEGEFGTILCLSVLEHLEDPRAAIVDMRRVLKPGGRIIVSVPFMFPIHDATGDYWRFTKYGLKYLFREGWIIEKLCAESNSQETFAILFQRWAYQSKFKFDKIIKSKMFVFAKILDKMPNFVIKTFGDIKKTVEEPEAFASAFFLVATKNDE